MKTIKNAAGHPAGGGIVHASALQISALLLAGQLAVTLCSAERAAAESREIYIRKLREFEGRFGRTEGRLDPANAAHADIIAFTADRRAAYRAAKARVYSIKRKLRAACLKLARMAAVEGGVA